MKNIHTGQVKSLLCLYTAIFMYYVKYTQRELNTRRGQQGFRTLCCDVCGLLENQFLRNNNNKGSRSNVNKHELVHGESSSNAEMHQCLFIICVIVYNLYYCCYAKTSSPAAQKRHSKVYGNPIAFSLYSILLGMVNVPFRAESSYRDRLSAKICDIFHCMFYCVPYTIKQKIFVFMGIFKDILWIRNTKSSKQD